MKKRMISLVLILVMLLGMMPVTALAEEGNEGSTAISVTLSGLHNMQISALKLYTYTDGVKGETDLLEGVAASNSAYTVDLPAGDYWVEGYDKTGLMNGGVSITVSGQDNSFTIQRMYELSTNGGWVRDTDYTMELTVTDAQGNVRTSALGQGDFLGATKTTCVFVLKDTVEVTCTPIGEKADSYLQGSAKKTPTLNDKLSVTMPKVNEITITAPVGSTISAGTFGTYYVYSFVEPNSVTQDENGVTAVFRVPETSANHFYRVQNPDGVTYWNFAKWTSATTIDVTAEDLKLNSNTFTKDTVSRFDKNKYDMANIYLNANGQGYLDLDVDETYELNVFRNWMAIESISNAKVGLPDMHYTVIDMEGNPSDIVTITPDANNSSVATMTAKKAGAAVVLVTYDAMTHVPGQGGGEFSSIWPEFTGVIVVTVDADGSSIQTNMMMDRLDSTTTALDAEHDILFYLGDAGASYSFKPEDGCTVTVNRSTVSDKMTFAGFDDEGVTVAEDGTVTVSGLTTGRHIIKVEKNGLATYQVVTARQVSYVLQDAGGNALAEDAEIKPGDTIKLQFTGLVSPAEKLSGVYNFNFSLYYLGESGTAFRSNPGGSFGVYDFSGNPVRQNITITIPEDWTEETYSLHGAIKLGGFAAAPIGGHREVTYATGKPVSFDAISAGMILSQLPELTISVTVMDAAYAKAVEKAITAIGTVTLQSEAAINAARAAYNALTDDQKALVANYKVLTNAEAAIVVIKAHPDASAVIAAIEEIGEVTLEKESAITNTRTAYDALTAEQKALVTNYDTLAAAEAKLADLQAAKAVTDAIAAIGEVTLEKEGAITAARAACNALTAEQKALVTNEGVLTAAEARLAHLQRPNPTPESGNNKITVTFRLIGAEKATQDVDLDTSTYLPEYVTWTKARSYTLNKDATVGDLFEQALDRAGLSYEGLANNYISSITAPTACGGYALADSSNGQFSGWMYTVNGSHPNRGLNDWTLFNGDEVVWHYVNDYRYEVEDYSGGSSGNESTWNKWLDAPDVNPASGGGSGTVTTPEEKPTTSEGSTVAPQVTASNGEAKAEVSEKNIFDVIAAAQKDGISAIVISPVIKGNANKVVVELPTSAVKDIVSDTDAALNVQTDIGALNIPNDTLSEIVKAAGTANISMSVEKVDAAAVKEKLPETAKVEGAVAVEFKITSGDKTISAFDGKALEVSVPVSTKDHANSKSYVAFVLSDDGTVERTVAVIKNGAALLTMRHFSTVVVTKEETANFADVAAGEYYYGAVLWAVAKGITSGTSATTFSPDAPCTRAQMATFLWHAAGSPVPSGKTSVFTDVKTDAYYFKALLWAAENGITSGTGNAAFGPDAGCTRAQMVTFLWRAAGSPAPSGKTGVFTDVKTDAYYFKALLWAAENGVTSGTSAATFSPDAPCTRGQMATFLYRCLAK